MKQRVVLYGLGSAKDSESDSNCLGSLETTQLKGVKMAHILWIVIIIIILVVII